MLPVRCESYYTQSPEKMNEAPVLVGIDVGGQKKGFHAVALQGHRFVDKYSSADPGAVIDWCVKHRAQAVGIDAPCRWSKTGHARPAEKELAKAGIHAFATPILDAAIGRPFYDWMFNGERLYQSAARQYHLFDGTHSTVRPVCFKTFPQAVACALAGKIVPAKQKSTNRRQLLDQQGIDASTFTNIDWVDAALCAVTATYLWQRRCHSYGDRDEGFIVVPDPRRDDSVSET